MDLYTLGQVSSLSEHTFAFINVVEEHNVLTVRLDRANKKNALHPQMVNEIAFAMNYAHLSTHVWLVVMEADGNVFCAGADLKAMAGIIEPHNSTIPDPQKEILIGEIFNKVHKPTIAKVTGDVYAGGFFFLAGCNIVIAQEDVKFGLPEVKRGIYPFQVMASLMNVMPPRKVIDWCIRGYTLPVQDAEKFGLITKCVSKEDIDQEVDQVIAELKQNSPSAMRYGLEAYDTIYPSGQVHKYLMEMLQKTIFSQDGQEGLKAFREKRKPNWVGE